MNPDFTSSQLGPSSAENAMSLSLSYPETVIPTELRSEKENEFEGLSMTLILPNTTVLDRIQYRQANSNEINNLFTKEKTKSTILLASVCSHLTIAFFLHAAFLCSLFYGTPPCHLGFPLLCSCMGAPVSATHASGTVNRAPASCLQSRAIEKPTTRLYKSR